MAKGNYIGALNEIIAIESQTHTTNPTGGTTVVWTLEKENLWAKVEHLNRSDEQIVDQNMAQVIAFNRKRFTFRIDPDFTLTETMRIIHEGQPHDILVIGRHDKAYMYAECLKKDNEQ
jgi:SPP1 family predicted phage head-tail adaptor